VTSRARLGFMCLILVMSGCAMPAPRSASPTVPLATASPSPTPVTAEAIANRTVTPTAVVAVPAGFGRMIATPDAVWLAVNDGLARVDPATNRVARTIVVAGGAHYLAYGFGSFWVSNFDDQLVRRVDAVSGRTVAQIRVAYPLDLVATSAGVWVTNHHAGTVSLIDPATNAVAASVIVGPTGPSGPHELAVIDGRVWVTVENASQVVAFDPATRQVTETVEHVASPGGPLVATGNTLWVAEDLKSVNRVDLPHGAELANTWVGGIVGTMIAVPDGVWLTLNDPETPNATGRLLKLSAATGQAVDAVAVPQGCQADGSVVAFGSIWVDCDNGTLLRLAPSALP
jgi:YVTN family beta-propeller protein